jgi:hypothetical protein
MPTPIQGLANSTKMESTGITVLYFFQFLDLKGGSIYLFMMHTCMRQLNLEVDCRSV